MGIRTRNIIPPAFIIVAFSAFAQEEKPAVPPETDRRRVAKEIRELFKDEYARRDADSRRSLAAKLLAQAEKSRGDSASSFVLLFQASEVARDAGDLETAFAAIEKMEEYFDFEKSSGVDDPVDLKMEVLSKVQRTARDPDVARSIAKKYLAVARSAASKGNFRTAQDGAKKASSLARKLRDRALASAATDFTKAVPELKREFEAASKVDLSKAIDIGDKKSNLNAGRYLAFAKGDWERGMEYLQWSGEEGLAAAAKKELERPEDPAGRFAVGESWWALSGKERSPLQKQRYLDRARTWYERASDGAEGLLQVRIDKRLDALVTLAPGEVDLLRLIRPADDAVKGEWALDGRTLVMPKGPGMVLQVPYQPPDEYDIEYVVTPGDGSGVFIMGLVAEGRPFDAVLNGAGGAANGLERLDGTACHENESSRQGGALSPRKKSKVLVSVRKSGVTVLVDGGTVIQWKGPYVRLDKNPQFKGTNDRALTLACWESGHRLTKMLLRTISGQGKKLR